LKSALSLGDPRKLSCPIKEEANYLRIIRETEMPRARRTVKLAAASH